MSVSFSSADQSIIVSRNPDGSHSCSGRYHGAAIKRAVPTEDGEYCILLLDWDGNRRLVFENLLCIDRKGNPIWTAKLPSMPGCIVPIAPAPRGLLATTCSGFRLRLDEQTGAQMKIAFVK